jgi:hypothetical protein
MIEIDSAPAPRCNLPNPPSRPQRQSVLLARALSHRRFIIRWSINGLDWKGRWSHRFALQRKDEYRKSRVLPRIAFSDTSGETLFDTMHEAEKFHMENMPHCGGF